MTEPDDTRGTIARRTLIGAIGFASLGGTWRKWGPFDPPEVTFGPSPRPSSGPACRA